MKLWSVLLLGLLFSAGETLAQSDRATISGSVTDVSGAIITGAKVIATNVSNNSQSFTETSGAGRFTLLNLPAGQYTLTCTKDTFKAYQRIGIDLAVSEAIEIDIALTIGSKTEIVGISGDPPRLQTQTSSISANLNNASITDLPLNVQGGRNLAAFMFAYVPGVEGNGVTPSDQDFGSHINGSLTNTKEVMIDGTSAVSQIGGYLSESSPPMEAVQEFQVTSAGIDSLR